MKSVGGWFLGGGEGNFGQNLFWMRSMQSWDGEADQVANGPRGAPHHGGYPSGSAEVLVKAYLPPLIVKEISSPSRLEGISWVMRFTSTSGAPFVPKVYPSREATMRSRKFLIILLLSLSTACSHPLKGKAANSAPPGLPPELANFDSYQHLRVIEDWIIGASSQSRGSEDQSTEFFAYHRAGGLWSKVYSQQLRDAYNPRIEVREDLTYYGSPLLLLHVNYGAAAETLDVLAISQGTLTSLQSLLAGTFEWSFDQERTKVILCGIPGSPVDPTYLYIWDGKMFKPFNGKLHL